MPDTRMPRRFASKGEPLAGAFFWLSAFYVVYCARPEDWIPPLKYIPLAKIAGIFALAALIMSAGKAKRGLRDLPREAKYLFAMICLLFVSALLSPVWRGGAFFKTVDFSKALVAWVLTFCVITTFARLRRIIFIQSASVAVICIVSILKGRGTPRLEGVIGGIYSNPNDLAFAIVLTLPFCFAFLLSTRSIPRKAVWGASMLIMCTALFMTASRAGFINLLVTGTVCLWLFGIKGKRIHLVVAAAVVALVIGVAAGGRLKDRFFAISGRGLQNTVDESAYDSYEQRRYLMFKSVEGIEHYPLGLGLDNFTIYSGTWREVHMAYLQIAVEGGIASLILYLLFFARGFSNLRQVRHSAGYSQEIELFSGALYATLVGFVVGALFAPEAYQYFPYFAVAYTSVLLAIAREREPSDIAPAILPDRTARFSRQKDPARELASTRGASGRFSKPQGFLNPRTARRE
ncbi:MAG: O-antigen ligase family protein [Candidatus Sulfotelmatobacter sp.]